MSSSTSFYGEVTPRSSTECFCGITTGSSAGFYGGVTPVISPRAAEGSRDIP